MRVLLIVLACTLTGCLPQSEPHSYFNEKVRCSTEGRQQLDRRGGETVDHWGYWGYNHDLDTCVGVFFTRDMGDSTAIDLLTEELLEICYSGEPCNFKTLLAKWLPDNPRAE